MSKLVSDALWQVRRASQNGNVVVIRKTCTLPAPAIRFITKDNIHIDVNISPIPTTQHQSIVAPGATKNPVAGRTGTVLPGADERLTRTLATTNAQAIKSVDSTKSPAATATPSLVSM